jgi:acetoacetyl-CoA synthetase
VAGVERCRGDRRRPGGGLHAQHARIDHRHAGGHLPGGGLVVLLAGFRHQGRAGPLRPDQAQGALHRRRLFFQGKAHRLAWRASPTSWPDSLGGKLVVVPYTRKTRISAPSPMPFCTVTSNRRGRRLEIDFAQLPFDHPLYIMYSSGTTGLPKCMVQSAGGILIHHLKELVLHTDLTREDTIFYFTTCGWMMWNWLVSSLATGATLVLYDGNPFHPSPKALWQMAQDEKITVFGTSAGLPGRPAGRRGAPRKNSTSLRCGRCSPPVRPCPSKASSSSMTPSNPISSWPPFPAAPTSTAVSPWATPWGRSMPANCSAGAGHEGVCLRRRRPARGGPGGGTGLRGAFPSMPIYFWNDPTARNTTAPISTSTRASGATAIYIVVTEHGGVVMHGRSDAT